MSGLNGTFTLDKFSIPGTHDSGTEKIADGYAHTQNFGIATQLEDGIRFLDIRVSTQNNSGDPLKVMHGIYSCKISFGDVLNSCTTFLTANTRETIIMLMDSASDSSGDIEAGFKTYLAQDQYKDLFYLEGNIPPLDTIRGKIILFRRFEIEGSGVMGVNLSEGWKKNETFSLTTPDGVKLEIEDQYKQHDTNKKVKLVQDCLNVAIDTPDDGIMYMTYNSLATNGFHTPYQYAWGGNGVKPAMNVSLEAYLAGKTGERRYGVIMLDFYNDHGRDNGNVESIIGSNAGLVSTT
ncbi:MAG: phosphatidylinositol-specific phospholipase C domain-containing protein [Methyloprofundus sp.]|nr:phosphatidylinositol-specific phospholipase C domain-containing protein [Methyloprofundus sp.]